MKRITSFIRLLVCLIFMAATTQHALAAIDITATQPANGTGTEADPYQISTPGELYWFAKQVNGGQSTMVYDGQSTICAKLTADIVVNENVLKAGTFTLNGTPANVWTPIGNTTNQFKGTFDGNGHTISGLYFNNTANATANKYIGLIGYATGATIKNVVVKDSYLRGYGYVAGICGNATGSTKISNCGFEGYSWNYGITDNEYSATVENCYSVSNMRLAYRATTNCYHDNTKYKDLTSNSIGKPSTVFASGEVAWLLNGGSSDGPWGQKVGTDATPVFGGDKVYATAICPHANSYSNIESVYTPIADGDEHYDADGFCKVCGAGHPATLVGDYYEIDNAGNLYWFAAQVNAGQATINAKLTADIVVNENVLQPGTFDLNGTPEKVWTPIGNYNNDFKGTFDGNGHTISGLYNNAAYSYIGLIGYATGATIKNVVVKDSYLRGGSYVAGICGNATGSTTITNCGFEGYVNAYAQYFFGIAYNYSATVENCYSVSNAPLSSKATTNCYHDNTKYTGSTNYSEGKPSTAFASGEVAWLLNGGSSDGPWGQKVGTDALPVLGGDKVYRISSCPHKASYTNTESVYTPIADGDEHYDADGFCKVCGQDQPATLVGDYYEIDNVGKLYWFAEQVNAGQTTINAKLTTDIVVNENVLKPGTLTLNGTPERVWTPIGNKTNQFKGIFDGNNHTISGLYFNNTAYVDANKYIALIGYGNGATIKNVVVKDSYLNGNNYIAGICGYATGSTTITNCGYEGYVYGSNTYGIAYNYSATVENCYSVSDQPLSNKATTNCYHDNSKYTSSTTYSTGKPSLAFASGEVALLLGDAWGQKIGTDVLPIPGSDKVYKNTYSGECPGEGYSNVDEHGVVTERNHNCNEEGVCIQCGFYIISTADQLYAFAAKVNSGKSTISAKLTADIVVNENVLKAGTFDLNGTPANVWTPIGTSSKNFKGTFDGNGHTISGLYFNNTAYSDENIYIALIGYGNGATIKNVVVKDSYLNGYDYVAGICGYATGSTTITNCGFEGYVYGSTSNKIHGISYNHSATVKNCYSVSNKPLAEGTTTNCYHDNNKYTHSTTYSTGKSSIAFASGEVAFLLGEGWGQKFGTDVLPIPGGDKVYKNTYSGECSGEGYSNVDEHGVVTNRNHNFNEEGVCTQCGFHLISTADQLYAFAAKVNAGGTTLCAKLTADIVVNENVLNSGTFDLNGTPSRSWTPIGTFIKRFQGTFDGNGHTISGLYFNKTTNSTYPAGGNYIGLIGEANGATIKNVVVKDSYIKGSCFVAGICGGAYGSTQITNCGYEGYVYGDSYAYGIAYHESATIKNCYSVSSQPLSNKATTNCYHDKNKFTESTTYSTGKPSEAFATGEVAFLLGDAWGQKFGTDATLRLGGDKVYKNTYSGECSGEGYSNVDEHGVVTERNHNCNAEGVCTQCGFYIISTADQLYAFAARVNAGQTTLSAKLTADIVVNENVLKTGTLTLNGTPSRSWTPIGTSSNNFKGTFDGDGHTISGLYFNNTTNSNYPEGGKYIGLIGYAYGATIKNVVVKDSYLNGPQYLAGICGSAGSSTQITNCGYEGYVYGDSYAYGIAYNSSATVENCYSVSNQRLAFKATTNCYHDNNKFTGSTANSTGKLSEAFANGEVAFLLGEGWGQKIGTDATPKLGGAVIYSITTTIATGGHGTFICPSYANEGETITCSSEPNIGYELVLNVNGNAHTGNTFTMPAENTTLLVDFTKIDYAVTTATGLTGGSVSADATAQYQDEVTVTVTPATGYKLDAISVKDASDNAVSVSNGKFTMPASAVNVTASFSKIDYAVTTATGLTGGSVSADATAQYQDQVTITATPAVGYKLDAITVKDASNNAVAVTNGKFTMPASAVNVTASFSKIDYAVTTATGLTGGSVSADATAQYQDEVTVTVTPATGYKLDAISVKDASDNAVSVSNGKFTMPASAVNVSASFSKIDYAVTTATGLTGGSVSVDRLTAQYQDEVTVTATPAVGYVLDAISVTDASNNAVAVTNGKFTMPASAVNVTAQFVKIDYAVTTATGLTGGSVSADATAQYQDEVTVTVTPA
ncbi:MAG: hypothetical protein MJZ31_11620, partial [Bacteroidales bacterium]|nr:hypothetical protein [Bacteroidales bacterium]